MKAPGPAVVGTGAGSSTAGIACGCIPTTRPSPERSCASSATRSRSPNTTGVFASPIHTSIDSSPRCGASSRDDSRPGNPGPAATAGEQLDHDAAGRTAEQERERDRTHHEPLALGGAVAPRDPRGPPAGEHGPGGPDHHHCCELAEAPADVANISHSRATPWTERSCAGARVSPELRAMRSPTMANARGLVILGP